MKFPISFSLVLTACLMALAEIAAAKPQASLQKLSATEKWVVEQVNAGKAADLSERFPDPESRTLNSSFLQELLTGRLPGLKPYRNRIEITSAKIDEILLLVGEQIPFDIWFRDCRFTREVFCTEAIFTRSVFFYGCEFREAIFDRAKVAATISFASATFKSDVNLNEAEVGDLDAERAVFEDTASLSCQRMKANYVVFREAVFQGPVSFDDAHVTGNLDVSQASSKDVRQGFSCRRMKIDRNALFREIKFDGSADFSNTIINDSFDAQKAKFSSIGGPVNFGGLKVTGSVSVIEARFDGGVDFNGADIGNNFDATRATFGDQASIVWLNVKCQGLGNFQFVAFRGRVSFANSSFLDLILTGSENLPPFVELDLSNSLIARGLHIRQVKTNVLRAQSTHVQGRAEFSDVAVDTRVDLRDGEFKELIFTNFTWPKGRDTVFLRRLTYEYFRAGSENEGDVSSHRFLLKLAEQSPYTPDVYTNLERFFVNEGAFQDAERAFIRGKRREREFLSGPAWIGNWIADVLTDYGRHPSFVGVPCVFFVALGTLLFRKAKMEVQKTEYEGRVYNPFWYSLGLFLPFVDLQADKIWKPQNDRWFLRHYMRVHILFGWIFVPILLAALTGLIK